MSTKGMNCIANKEFAESVIKSIDGVESVNSEIKAQVSELASQMAGKQDVLTAGDNISIVNNVISASGGSDGISLTPITLAVNTSARLEFPYEEGATYLVQLGRNYVVVSFDVIDSFTPVYTVGYMASEKTLTINYYTLGKSYNGVNAVMISYKMVLDYNSSPITVSGMNWSVTTYANRRVFKINGLN